MVTKGMIKKILREQLGWDTEDVFGGFGDDFHERFYDDTQFPMYSVNDLALEHFVIPKQADPNLLIHIDKSCDIKHIVSEHDVLNRLDIYCRTTESISGIRKITQGLYCAFTKVSNFGELVEVGSLSLNHNESIQSLGGIKKIYKGGLWADNTPNLTSLGDLTEVGSEVHLENSGIETLGNLKRVNGKLVLTNSNVSDFGDLEYVKNMIELQGTPLSDSFRQSINGLQNKLKL